MRSQMPFQGHVEQNRAQHLGDKKPTIPKHTVLADN